MKRTRVCERRAGLAEIQSMNDGMFSDRVFMHKVFTDYNVVDERNPDQVSSVNHAGRRLDILLARLGRSGKVVMRQGIGRSVTHD